MKPAQKKRASPSLEAASNENEVMTLREVARYLRVSPTTVYRQARSGNLPAQRIGHTWRFSRAVIDRWLRGDQRMAPVLTYAGVFHDDDTLDEMVAEIYRQRK
jgi:excisionase family DNA binding protein